LLDRGSDVNARETQSWTPLHQASRYGYVDLARLLIDRGADVDAQKEDHWTALHLASHGGHLDIAKLLIDRGANIDCRNGKQQTPLGLASSFGRLEVARFLIEKGAAVSTQDKEGNKLRSKMLGTAEYGADDDGKGEAKDSLHTAAEEGNIDTEAVARSE